MLETKVARAAKATAKAKAGVARRTKSPTTTKLVSPSAAFGGYQDDLHERVRQRAYELWESEGRPAGREYDHWLQAEREVVATPRRQAA